MISNTFDDILQCGHCGNKTRFDTRASYCPFDEAIEYDLDPLLQELILQCPVCHEFAYVSVSYNWRRRRDVDEYNPYDRSDSEFKVLYPTPKSKVYSFLPENLKRPYASFIKASYIEPNACAVLAGRTLELVCNHEKANGDSLAQKLSSMASEGKLPKELSEMAKQVRLFRNLGAHAADDEISNQDVPTIVEFVDTILEYLYVLPAKIGLIEQRLNKQPKQ